MKKSLAMIMMTLAAIIMLAACMKETTAMKAPSPFGGKADIMYAKALWEVLAHEKLVGHGRIRTLPYEGMEPHGVILEQLSTMVTVKDHTGIVYVKANYMGDGMTRSGVVNDPDSYLGAYTVMFKREAGYDPETMDWFWVKYKADGSLHTNPKGMMLAGRVAKGMDTGCIACHSDADGGDFLFNNTADQLD
ncbi:MAG: hypothetical protein V6Z89_11675 [Desulfobacter sp.]